MLLQEFQLFHIISGESVDGYNDRKAELVSYVFYVFIQVLATLLQNSQVRLSKFVPRCSAMVVKGTGRRNDHNYVRPYIGYATYYVEELLSTEVSSESAFRNSIVSQSKSCLGSYYTVIAVRDIRERPAMHKSRLPFESLD
jgi:hypothetical protein